MAEYKPFNIENPGIDLRKELDTLFNEQKTAHWVVYRRFDLDMPSDHYVEITHEGVQGPKYKYNDELIEVRMSLVRRLSQNMEVSAPIGLIQNSPVVFYLKHTVIPKTDDLIYETTYQGSTKPASVPLAKYFTTKFNITAVFPMRDAAHGRTEYYVVYAKIANL